MSIPNWITFSKNTQGLFEIFSKEEFPDVSSISLHEIIFNRDGPAVTLNFDLGSFPKTPPKKWAESGYNTVKLKLAAIGVTRVLLDGLFTNMSGKLAAEKLNEACSLTFTMDSGRSLLHIECVALVIVSMSAYCCRE